MHDPVWIHTADRPHLPRLGSDERCDVCVVGAGIAGLSTAYRLARDGFDVVVLEKADRVAAGETHHTTAHLASAQDDRFVTLEKHHGREGSRHAAESHSAAIDWIERIAQEESVACDFRRLTGYLFLGPQDGPDLLDGELAAARRAGLSVERLARAPVTSFDTGPCLAFARQGEVNPLKFVAGLVQAMQSRGARLFGGARVVDVRDGEPCLVRTADGRSVTADHVVLATNSPAGRYLTTMKMVPYRTFAVAFALRGDVHRALYWDTDDPYHYVRLVDGPDGVLLLVGGGDHQTGTRDEGEARHKELGAWTRERFPIGEAAYAWSGQVLEPADEMAFIGSAETAGSVYVCTGDSGQGITHGVIAALLIGDLIEGRDNPWKHLYSPLRVSPKAAAEYVGDAVKVGRRYLDWLLPAEVGSEDEVLPGHGALMRRGGVPVAVYRDEDGVVHERSAVCTHAGCIVHWNSLERSWDCPCHGSRYAPDGEVVNGPAKRPLAPPPRR